MFRLVVDSGCYWFESQSVFQFRGYMGECGASFYFKMPLTVNTKNLYLFCLHSGRVNMRVPGRTPLRSETAGRIGSELSEAKREKTLYGGEHIDGVAAV